MYQANKSRKSLLMLTMLTILSTASVATVYAVLVGTFTGGNVTIGAGATGTVLYSTDGGSTWTDTASPADVNAVWYSKLSIDGGQFSGRDVTIVWQLQLKTGDGATDWSDVVGATITTSMSLAAGAQEVYATTDGLVLNNRDWGQDVTVQGIYRVLVTVNSV